jgi:hypothetical protein
MLVQNHQTCYVLRCGSRCGINLQQCKISSAIASHVRRNRALTAPHSNSKQQIDILWNVRQQVEQKKIKGNGHAFILGLGSNRTKKIQCILGARRQKSSRLFLQHHSPTHHREMRSQYVHSKLVPMIRYNATALKHTERVC